MVKPGLSQQVFSIKNNPGIHIPGDSVNSSIDKVCLPGSSEELILADNFGPGNEFINRCQGSHSLKFSHPGCSQLGNIRRNLSYYRSNKFLVCCLPGNCLGNNFNSRINLLKSPRHLGNLHSFCAHSPDSNSLLFFFCQTILPRANEEKNTQRNQYGKFSNGDSFSHPHPSQ